MTDTEAIYRDFLEETKDHRVIVHLDRDVFRCVDFKTPGTGMYGFTLVTWPGHLAITGDISDGLIFTRMYDMFEFFRADRTHDDIDFRYWAEKLTMGSREVQDYKPELFERDVDETQSYVENSIIESSNYSPERRERALESLAITVSDVKLSAELGPDIAYQALLEAYFYDGEDNQLLTEDLEIESWYDYNYRFYLNCYAIQAGIQAYNRYKNGGEGEWLHPESLLQAHGITRTPPSSE